MLGRAAGALCKFRKPDFSIDHGDDLSARVTVPESIGRQLRIHKSYGSGAGTTTVVRSPMHIGRE
jgi:hypothetical protein